MQPKSLSTNPKIPSCLLELQHWFGKIETQPLTSEGFANYSPELLSQIQAAITDGPFLPAAKRMEIYNQQYWWRLTGILQNHYPSLVQLFGPQDFNQSIAVPYLKKYPPNSWSLHALGSHLPRFLEEEYREKDIALVLPMAQIDEAYQRLGFAKQRKNSAKFSDSSLFVLQPFVSLFSFSADFFTFRSLLLDEERAYEDFPDIQRSKTPLYFVLFKAGGDFSWESITPSQFLLLKAFEKGSLLGEALSLLKGCKDEEEIGKWFQSWASRNWLYTYSRLSFS